MPGIAYLWEFAGNPLLKGIIKDANSPNTVISFPEISTGLVRVTATDTANGSCFARVFQDVEVSSLPGIEERKIFLKQPGNLLIYPDNTLSKYQWGTDSILTVSPDSSFGRPRSMANQVYQFYPGGSTLDQNNYLYWVLLEDTAGCKSRVYYNGPYAARQSQVVTISNPVELLVFPNPNQGNFDVSLKGNIYGDIQAKIYNALGQQVFTKKFVKNAPEVYEKFNAGKLGSGMYFLELYSSDLKKVVTRFIIQH